MTGRCTCSLPHGICPGGTCPCPRPHKMRADPAPYCAELRATVPALRPVVVSRADFGAATLAQITELHARLAAAGVLDYPGRAAAAARLTGRPVGMLNELTEGEAAAVLETMARGESNAGNGGR